MSLSVSGVGNVVVVVVGNEGDGVEVVGMSGGAVLVVAVLVVAVVLVAVVVVVVVVVEDEDDADKDTIVFLEDDLGDVFVFKVFDDFKPWFFFVGVSVFAVVFLVGASNTVFVSNFFFFSSILLVLIHFRYVFSMSSKYFTYIRASCVPLLVQVNGTAWARL